MNNPDLLDIALRGVADTWKKFCRLYPKLNAHPCPTVTISNRLKTTAGWAFYDTNEIILSRELMAEYTQHFLVDTIPHEVGHLVANIIYKHRGHGPEWKETQSRFGLKPARCHNLVNTLHEARKANRRK